MSDPVTEIRAFLLQFEKSGLRDIFVRTKDWTIFMARPNGAPNPLQQAPAVVEAAEDSPPSPASVTVTAPHLGLFAPECSPGDLVSAGEVIAAIDVLGRKTEVTARGSGRVKSVRFAANDLVEFGQTLLEIEAA